MGTTLSRVVTNAREQVLSGDLNRAQQLASREVQNLLAYMGSDSFVSPFSGAIEITDVFGDSSGFTATIGKGSGLFWDPTYPNLSTDESGYLMLRWVPTQLTFSNPDSTNPRIDLVVATPSQADADLQSRNILLDPQTRAMAAQNVYKTSNPASVISVITGTPAGSPVAPAVPAHTCALYEVLVPAGVANASLFTFRPRLWRKALFPGSVDNRIMSGCQLTWDLTVDPSSASSTLTLGGGPHKVLIDGEVITFNITPQVVQDAGANPFGSAAPANNSRPYYIYLCAGHNSPQGSLTTVSGTPRLVPAVLVESLTPPDADGHPTASISTPRGVALRGALYVGLGFVYKNTTNRQPCIMDATTTWPKGQVESLSNVSSSPQTLNTLPAGLRRHVILNVLMGSVGTNGAVWINPSSLGAPTAPSDAAALVQITGVSGTIAVGEQVKVPMDSTSTGLAFAFGGGTTVTFYVRGYGHGVRGLV